MELIGQGKEVVERSYVYGGKQRGSVLPSRAKLVQERRVPEHIETVGQDTGEYVLLGHVDKRGNLCQKLDVPRVPFDRATRRVGSREYEVLSAPGSRSKQRELRKRDICTDGRIGAGCIDAGDRVAGYRKQASRCVKGDVGARAAACRLTSDFGRLQLLHLGCDVCTELRNERRDHLELLVEA